MILFRAAKACDRPHGADPGKGMNEQHDICENCRKAVGGTVPERIARGVEGMSQSGELVPRKGAKEARVFAADEAPSGWNVAASGKRMPWPGDEHRPSCAMGEPARAGMQRALAYIHANLGERLSVEDIARAAGVDARQFARMFKRFSGIAPRLYLTWARFELAKTLIRAGGRNFTQIAAEVGFTDQSHMTHIFKRMTGVTPKAFRDI